MSQLQRIFSWQSGEFQTANSHHYRLRCVVKTGYFAFAVLSAEGKIIAVRELHGPPGLDEKGFLESVMLLEKELKAKYEQVEFISIRNNFQMIPGPVYREEAVHQYLQLAGGTGGGVDVPIANKLAQPDAFLLFPAFKTLREKITLYFEGIQYRHITEMLLACLKELSESKGNGILAHLHDKTLFVFSINGGTLRIANAYEVREAGDAVYYIQLVARISDLASGAFPLWLSGDIESEGAMYKQIKKLMPQANVPLEFFRSRFAPNAEKVPASKYAFFSF